MLKIPQRHKGRWLAAEDLGTADVAPAGADAAKSEPAGKGDEGAGPATAHIATQDLALTATIDNEEDAAISAGIDNLAQSGDGRAALSLTNTGPAIPAEDQPRLFDRFFRGDKARGPADGFGLGLNIAAELARANDGTLRLVRSVEDDTVFALSLPVA